MKEKVRPRTPVYSILPNSSHQQTGLQSSNNDEIESEESANLKIQIAQNNVKTKKKAKLKIKPILNNKT